MKKLLKYLLLGIMALAFYNGAKGGFLVSETDVPGVFQNEYSVSNDSSISSTEAGFCLPRQVSSVSVPRLQNNCRRHETSHRHHYSFVQSGKTVNPGVRYIVQKQSLFSHSSHIRPSNRLHYLGQLII